MEAETQIDRWTETQEDRRAYKNEIIGVPAERGGPRTIPKLLLVLEIYMLKIFAEVKMRFCTKKTQLKPIKSYPKKVGYPLLTHP